MNRACVVLGFALIVAAAAPSREPQRTAALDLQQTAQESQVEQTGDYMVSSGIAQGLSYSLRFIQPNEKAGGLASGQFLLNRWDGIAMDRESTAQHMERLGIWDSVAEGTQLTLTIPGADIAQVEVRFDPNTVYDGVGQPKTEHPVYMPKSINMTPDVNGELHSCRFPVSFQPSPEQKSYQQLFCTITVTFQDGNSCDIGLALTQIL